MYERKKVIELMRRLTGIRTSLLSHYPFYGQLLMALGIGLAPCGTACTDMRQILFDPEFTDRLDDEELMFVMIHEVMHCALKHCIRGRELDQDLYNTACDIVVNSNILKTMGVSRFVVDGEEAMCKGLQEKKAINILQKKCISFFWPITPIRVRKIVGMATNQSLCSSHWIPMTLGKR